MKPRKLSIDVIIALTCDDKKPYGVYVTKNYETIGRYSGKSEIITTVFETDNYSDALLWRDNIRIALGV
jgi:hypothetical protein